VWELVLSSIVGQAAVEVDQQRVRSVCFLVLVEQRELVVHKGAGFPACFRVWGSRKQSREEHGTSVSAGKQDLPQGSRTYRWRAE
jgi:hypothetical protein